MSSVGQRIREARQAKKLTQKALAQHLGINRVSVTQWESGQTGPERERLPEIANVLGGSVEYYMTGEGLAPPGQEVRPDRLDMAVTVLPPTVERIAREQPNASPPVPISFPTSRIPIYGQAVGGDDGRFVLNGQRVADLLCPPQLQGVPNAYGVFVHGESMEPRYYAGEALFLNPNLPVRRGDFVVVQIAGDSEADDAAGYVKRFVSMNSKELVLEQFKPREDVTENAPEAERFTMRFPRSKVVAVHKIVGTANG